MADRKTWRGNRQPLTWFVDLSRRDLLELDPPYQRRSVWNHRYREDFIETVLLGYPAPSVFLYEDIADDGTTRYSVVDGKQRLTTILDFVGGIFPTRDEGTSLPAGIQGKYFSDLDTTAKQAFWAYELTVEYIPSTDEALLTEVFDRINRNVAKLTRQELRHARYGTGVFAKAVEALEDEREAKLGSEFPRIVESSRRQMKDLEFAATLALLLERGPDSTSQDDLDGFYADREAEWEDAAPVAEQFRTVTDYLRAVVEANEDVRSTRFRNQGDFYALFGAVKTLAESGELPAAHLAAARLIAFATKVSDGDAITDEAAKRYYDAARSAANDTGQRQTRIGVLVGVLSGEV